MGRRKIEPNYILPREVYMSTLWYIRNYRRWILDKEAIVEASPPPPDGQPRGAAAGDPTSRAAIRLAIVSAKLKPIELALDEIPEEYRAGILGAIIERRRYPDYADLTTWKRWRQRFVFFVAKELGYHEAMYREK
jgi:hypothetical protein